MPGVFDFFRHSRVLSRGAAKIMTSQGPNRLTADS